MKIKPSALTYTVITGASSGIGYETAKAFATRGKHLILIARRRALLESLKTEILNDAPNLDIQIFTADLSSPEEALRLYDALRQYNIDTWVNNAGFGSYASVADQDLAKISTLIRLNIEALTLLSSLFVRDYQHQEGTQLINISSAGGYTIVPTAITYCASKFYVSAFTEGLDRELAAAGSKMRAKVLAPAATQTEFAQVANNLESCDYDHLFANYHSSAQVASFLLALYDSDCTVGAVDRETFEFKLSTPRFDYAGSSKHNQMR